MTITVGLVYGGNGAETGINIQAAKDFARVLEYYNCKVRYIDINDVESITQLRNCSLSVGIEKNAKEQNFINSFNDMVKRYE